MEPHYDLVMVEPTPSNLVWLKSSFNLVSYSNLVTYLWKPSSHPPPTTYLSHHKINCKVSLFLSLLCYLLITSNKEGKGSNPRLKSSSTRGKGDWVIWGLYKSYHWKSSLVWASFCCFMPYFCSILKIAHIGDEISRHHGTNLLLPFQNLILPIKLGWVLTNLLV
jgi:hypothetical protein